LDPRTPLTSAEGLQPPGEPWPDFHARFEAAYVAEMSAFLGAARGETDSPCTVEDALAALYLAEAAELSRHEGRPVRTAEVIS
ncbi:Gfo/Idh/MocA family oxidoreductase, partial [Streptosporangium canum]|uniref:Gfo/Idh/MocA family oxidoreductase n=1 Tax=Streptosporangium canum TaxID=324952 RepID=UPI0034316825